MIQSLTHDEGAQLINEHLGTTLAGSDLSHHSKIGSQVHVTYSNI